MKTVLRIFLILSWLHLYLGQFGSNYVFSRYLTSSGKPQCEIDIYFTTDASKSVKMPTHVLYEENIFPITFFTNLEKRKQLSNKIKWRYTAFNFFDNVEPIISLTDQSSTFIKNINAESPIGQGTYADCVLKETMDAIQKENEGEAGLTFSIFLTYGNSTGNHCGGLSEASRKLRNAGIKTFVVAKHLETIETELQAIASYPLEMYLDNHGVNNDMNRTISRILDIMEKEAESECGDSICLAKNGDRGSPGLKGLKGMKGSIGMAGDPGPMGSQGDPGIEGTIGFPGPKGYPGQKGERGDFGDPGKKGDSGKFGFSGTVGEKGKTGRIGSTGCKGEVGVLGEDGPAGNVGFRGVSGYSGQKGFIGKNGQSGPPGSKGAIGDKGHLGYQGNIGLPGIKGLKGAIGQVGIAGDQGIRGYYGLSGPRGSLGQKGQQGEPGKEGQRGSPGERGNKGGAGVSGFPGPRGPSGEPGSIGENGSPGDPGYIGARGDTGLAGSIGDKGKPGNSYAGARGLQGSRGEPGLPGFPGLRGHFGEKGFQGTKGTKGETGEFGPNGQQGGRGPTGDPGFSGVPGQRGDPGITDCEITSYLKEICGCCGCYKFCQPTDLVFVLDISENVGTTNFSLAKNFVINISNRVGKMSKNPSDQKVVVQYSHQDEAQSIKMHPSNLGKDFSTYKVKSMEWMAGGTWTSSAMKNTYDQYIHPHQRAVKKVLAIVITDGLYDSKNMDKLESLCEGADVFAIGIGETFNSGAEIKELQRRACNTSHRVKNLNMYAELVDEEFLEDMDAVLCQDPEIICPDQICKQASILGPLIGRPVDIVFFVDGSERTGKENLVNIMRFIKHTAEKIKLAENDQDTNGARIAIIQYAGENEQNVHLDFTYDLANFQTLPSKAVHFESSSHISIAILYAIKNVVQRQSARFKGARQNAEVCFVFITDGMSNDKNLTQALSSLQANNIVTSAIAVGSSFNHQRLFQLVMKDDASLFRLKTFEQLFTSSFIKNFLEWLG